MYRRSGYTDVIAVASTIRATVTDRVENGNIDMGNAIFRNS